MIYIISTAYELTTIVALFNSKQGVAIALRFKNAYIMINVVNVKYNSEDYALYWCKGNKVELFGWKISSLVLHAMDGPAIDINLELNKQACKKCLLDKAFHTIKAQKLLIQFNYLQYSWQCMHTFYLVFLFWCGNDMQSLFIHSP